VQVHERGSFPKVKVSYVPMPCQHCVEAPCIGASKEGAVYQRADGIVLIDPDKAAGQFDIVGSCPYGAVFWNEAKRMPQKCTLCAHLLDAGRGVPRCVEACPTGALVFGDRNDPNSAISTLDFRRRAEPLHPEYGTSPLVEYCGLPKRFIAGEIVLADDAEQPAHGVTVTLRHGKEVSALTTDRFGDFEFDGLPPDREYALSISHPGYRRRELTLSTQADINVGPIVLDPISPESRSNGQNSR
jgi:Fe-S-cluster-containing dehydrogenase component